MIQLYKHLEELESYISDYEKSNPKVSAATVGWQIGHSFKVMRGVCSALKNSNPEDYKTSFNWKRSIALTIGRFPRGIAKSPKRTRPEPNIAPVELKELMTKTRENLLELDSLSKSSWFTHPIFGDLNLSQSKRFLELHTYHHVLIIRDIIK